jgi:acetyltransferase-like isoleucine patch superfamily enzyme
VELNDELHARLVELWSRMQAHQATELGRSLPFADGLADRWERARFLGFGEGTSVYDSCVILGDVRVGRNTWIGPNTVLDGSGGLIIGDFCSISAGAQVYSHNTVEWALSGGESPPMRRPTSIGSRCYIGPNTVVEMGAEIGDGCVIGAFSLVRGSLPPGSRAWGQPCRVIS